VVVDLAEPGIGRAVRIAWMVPAGLLVHGYSEVYADVEADETVAPVGASVGPRHRRRCMAGLEIAVSALPSFSARSTGVIYFSIRSRRCPS